MTFLIKMASRPAARRPLLFLLSPTKTLDESALPDAIASRMTQRIFPGETESLVRAVKTLSKQKLSKVFGGVSARIADLNHGRYVAWSTQPEKCAAYAFDGPAFRGLRFAELDSAAADWAQERFRILSGLFGVLRPLDAVKPYRLEMGSKMPLALADAEEQPDASPTTLYKFWGDKICDHILSDLDPEGPRVVLNLASQEYWKAAREARLIAEGARVVHCRFCEPNGRVISVYAKRARGMMARFLIDARAEAVADATAFVGYKTMETYAYSKQMTTESELVFVRRASAPKAKPAKKKTKAPKATRGKGRGKAAAKRKAAAGVVKAAARPKRARKAKA